jgi:hypothetical protein
VRRSSASRWQSYSDFRTGDRCSSPRSPVSASELGIVSEYAYDGRTEWLVSPFENDLFLGLRFAFNDVQSTEFLAGGSIDLETVARTFRVEASRRFGESWKRDL